MLDAAVDRALPGAHQLRGVGDRRRVERARREREAIALGARIADRHFVHVREARQQAAIQQGERGALLAAIPQLARGGADVGRQALGTDVEILHVRRAR